MKGILSVIGAISSSFNVQSAFAGKILARFILLSSGLELSEYTKSLPKLQYQHNGSVIVVSTAALCAEKEGVAFVPLRHIKKKFLRNVCTFCDNVLNGNCHHTRTISLLLNEQDGMIRKGYMRPSRS